LPKLDEFKVQRERLIEPLTIEDIEYREIIHDPLNAVPAKPFGHFYPAWEKFRSQLGPVDQIWSFTAILGSYNRPRVVRSGYVTVVADVIGPFFISKLDTV